MKAFETLPIMAIALKSLKRRIVSLLIALFLFSPIATYSQVSQTGVIFLLISPDARGRSMGDGGSVFSTGAVSAFYNPANLVTVNPLSAEFTRCRLLPGLAEDFLFTGFCLGVGSKTRGHYAFSYHRVGWGKEIRRDERGNFLGEFGSYEYALCLYGAFALDSTFHFGCGFKYIHSHMPQAGAGAEKREGVAESAAVDLGLSIRNLFPELTIQSEKPAYPRLRKFCRARNTQGITIGISVANLGPNVKYIDPDQSDPLPRNLRLGAGYQIVDIDEVGLRATVDATKLLVDMDDRFKTEWQEIIWYYGWEATLFYCVTLRGGRHLDRVGYLRFWSLGFSVGPEWLRFDYSQLRGGEGNNRGKEKSFSVHCNIPPHILQW